MLDIFAIFSHGGIVLWFFQENSSLNPIPPVNALIKSVILQERAHQDLFNYENLSLKFKLDNEFDLVFVVGYQKILQLSYVDKFLTDIQKEFRERYKNDLLHGKILSGFADFESIFKSTRNFCEDEARKARNQGKGMRSFDASEKSQKTVNSMITKKGASDGQDSVGGSSKSKKGKSKKGSATKENESSLANGVVSAEAAASGRPPASSSGRPPASPSGPKATVSDGSLDVVANRERMLKMMGKGKPKSPAAPAPQKDRSKKNRVWDGVLDSGKRSASQLNDLDFSGGSPKASDGQAAGSQQEMSDPVDEKARELVGTMGGDLQGLVEDDDVDVEDEAPETSTSSSSSSSFFSALRGLVGSKSLTEEDIAPALQKMKETMISKNVASEIAEKLCDSVAQKLQGKVVGTFSTINATVRQSLTESCVQILSPKRRVDILRDAVEAQRNQRPYVITFCGVNGVGKSTNLAKISFWLIENNLQVLIAAGDTFRSGAVEQLRTHTRKLNHLHPPENHGGKQMVQLFEKGYGKDPAGIAMEAINHARQTRIDVVLVDTAGRMQDNEPLMRSLAKLIKVNSPDLVLFVGEALVGNDAIDQLTKFNQSLADFSQMNRPRLIDGIVLTKFDTIDDKVGAAVSMTYTTGQPIVFVGTGQTYTDLKSLNAKAVVAALLK